MAADLSPPPTRISKKTILKNNNSVGSTSAAKAAPMPRGQLAPRGTPVAVKGKLAHVGDKPRRKAGRTARARMKFPIQIDIRIVRAMLKLPMLDAEIQKGKRLALLQLASACVPSLLS